MAVGREFCMDVPGACCRAISVPLPAALSSHSAFQVDWNMDIIAAGVRGALVAANLYE